MKPKAIFFDWDGTIEDSFDHTLAFMNDTLEAFGKPIWGDAEGRRRIGAPDHILFPEVFGDDAEQALDLYTRLFRAHDESHPMPVLMPGVEEALRFVFARHAVHTGVISGYPGQHLRPVVKKMGWADKFNRVVGAGDALADKPDPRSLEFALQDYNGPRAKEDIWYVGDSYTDMVFAHNTGVTGVLLGDKPSAEQMAAHPPDLHFDGMGPLLAHMRKVFG